jgi:Protein of unknown function (DUF4054)
MSIGPDVVSILNSWWGGGYQGYDDLASIAAASNLVFGGNPLYQISDFLSVYPKFGTQPQGIVSAQPDPVTPGEGYQVNDQLVVLQQDALGGTVSIVSVGVGGVPTGYSVPIPGTGYIVTPLISGIYQGYKTTGGHGTGALVDVLIITPSNLLCIPQAVLQMYINLASAQLSQCRWGANWPIAMAWFVAHYATLYLRSEGNFGSTAGQVASSGLTRGIMVSKSAGGVSATIEVPKGLDDWGAWTETEYGTQLVTMAKVVGMGMIYAW